MTTPLTEQKCTPCEGGVKPLSPTAAAAMLGQLDAGWSLAEKGDEIMRLFRFSSFARTMAFVNAVAWVATVEGHHPELIVNYSSCEVRYSTHAINGLSDNDFICAAKIDRLAAEAG